MNDTTLAQLQQWLQTVIQHPQGPEAGTHSTAQDSLRRTIVDIVTPSRRLGAAERIEIYNRAYFARLLDCLESEFPAVRYAAGEDAFAGFAIGYLQACPSRSDSLADLGAGFVDYLAATRPPREAVSDTPDFADMLIDLARLERTYSEVFDGPGPETDPGLNPETLAGFSADEFAASRLRFHNSVRLSALRFPCHEYAGAVRKNQHPQPLSPSPTLLVIYRRGYVVRRCSVSPLQFELLTRLRDGATIGESLVETARMTDDLEQLTGNMQTWFAEWTRAPLFQDVVR